MPNIVFKTQPYKIKDWLIIKLPKDQSEKLPSRGQVMVKGQINSITLETPLEPDGRGSHWFKVSEDLQTQAKISENSEVSLEIKDTKDWTEPEVPKDLVEAIEKAKDIQKLWQEITPLARHEWVRWVSGTAVEDTRKHRIEVAISKMRKGERRPCCFNRSMCMEPYVCKSGALLEPL